MGKHRNLVLLLTFMFMFMLSLVGCSKKAPVESSESTEEGTFEETESTSVEETTKDIFAVDNPNILGYEIRESTAESHNVEEETREITFNAPDETTVDKVGLSDEEIAEFEVMEETFTHPITGEFFNRSDLANIYNMQYEAQVIWEPEFDAGRVDKATVEKYFNYVYAEVDKSARDKAIQEVLSPNIKVEFKEPESWPLEEESDVQEDVQSDDDDMVDPEEIQRILEGHKSSGNEAEQRLAEFLENGGNLKADNVVEATGEITTGDLSPYNPN